MKCGRALAALAIVSVLAMMLVPMTGTDSAPVTEDDIGIIVEVSSIDVDAGQSTSFNVVITNNLESEPVDSLANNRMISVIFETENGAKATSDVSFLVLKGQEYRTVIVTLHADKYAAAGSYLMKVHLNVKTLAADGNDSPVTVIEQEVSYKIESNLSAGSSYNQFLGIFENKLPAPFNDPLFTSVVSFVLWVILGLLALLILMPIVLRLVMHNHKEEGEDLIESTRKLIFPIVILYAVSRSLRVYGASETVVSTFEVWFGIMYILLGAIIIWKIYTVFLHYTVRKIETNLAEEDTSSSGSIEPLFRLLGKIGISIFAVAMILGSLGFSLAAIITSAGIVSLGITLGAQNVLNQFFSGLVLLITRPFKADDIVRLGTSTGTYKVVRVDIMNTVFKNWENEEVIIMPNNSVASASIINLTGNNKKYKIHVYMTVAYGTNLEEARRIMMDIAMSHPRVVKDGSVDKPYTRVTALGSSDIQLRLTVYVDDFNDYGMIEGELRVAMYKAFVDHDISIPFPQVEVHIDHKNKP